MTDAVLNRLAQRLLKCPFDPELFDSATELQSHLLDCHGDQICEKRRVPKRVAQKDIERPTVIHICGLCFEFMVPNIEGRNALSEIPAHGTETHSNPNLPPSTPPIWRSDDAALIDKFMTDQGLEDVCPCRAEGCRRVFSDVEAATVHWTKEHVEHAKPEDVQRVLHANPEQFCERFDDVIAEVLAETEAEVARAARAEHRPHDGYRIRHMPPVPRVRSRPSEAVIYITSAQLPKDELWELFELEGYDGGEFTGGDWIPERRQVGTVDLRFCHLEDGYVPLVKSVCGILPRLADGQTIEMAWQDDPDSCFPCEVRERAIYNLDGRLKTVFSKIPPGARLYIARVGPTRYQLYLKPHRHRVPNCKFFEKDGAGGWNVTVRDEWIDWESNDDIFRHQITFVEMDALYAEAEHTNLSVRDAVHDFMRRYAQSDSWHVRDIYEFVFQELRTCSLAAVWAQFRPEHECYERDKRAGVGRYMFNPNGAFPMVRYVPITRGRAESPRFPLRTEVEGPLLRAIIRRGGSVNFSDQGRELEIELAAEFGLSDAARDARDPDNHAQGHRMWRNELQFVRNNLVERREIDPSVRGVWTATDAGYRRVETSEL